MRTTQLTAGAIALMTLSTAALANRPEYFSDRAQVLSSTPIYQQVNEPRRECWTETVDSEYRSEPHSYGGALIGGVVGGLLGNTVGQGKGRTAAAAVGGDRRASGRQHQQQWPPWLWLLATASSGALPDPRQLSSSADRLQCGIPLSRQ
jgi:uncharacterized protein YcfJ